MQGWPGGQPRTKGSAPQYVYTFSGTTNGACGSGLCLTPVDAAKSASARCAVNTDESDVGAHFPALGPPPEAWRDPTSLKPIEGGLRWAAGLEPGNCEAP